MARRREREPCLSTTGRLARRAGIGRGDSKLSGCWFAAPEPTVVLVLSSLRRSMQCRVSVQHTLSSYAHGFLQLQALL